MLGVVEVEGKLRDVSKRLGVGEEMAGVSLEPIFRAEVTGPMLGDKEVGRRLYREGMELVVWVGTVLDAKVER